jgi:hypothetical protein
MQKSRGNVKSVDHESTIMLSIALNREREIHEKVGMKLKLQLARCEKLE